MYVADVMGQEVCVCAGKSVNIYLFVIINEQTKITLHIRQK